MYMCRYLWRNQNSSRKNVKFVCSRISFLIYSADAVVYAVSYYLAAAIKLPKRKTLNNFIADLHNIIQFVCYK